LTGKESRQSETGEYTDDDARAGARPASVVRRYRLESSPLIRDITHGWRTGRTALVMEGHFDLRCDVLPAGD
jgi:hypothetical protein